MTLWSTCHSYIGCYFLIYTSLQCYWANSPKLFFLLGKIKPSLTWPELLSLLALNKCLFEKWVLSPETKWKNVEVTIKANRELDLQPPTIPLLIALMSLRSNSFATRKSTCLVRIGKPMWSGELIMPARLHACNRHYHVTEASNF